LANVYMFEKRWLRVLGELGKVKDVVKYVSRYAPETFSAKCCATT